MMMFFKIADIENKVPNIHGKIYTKQTDKGKIGKQIELDLGLSNNSFLKDCLDGEVKLASYKKLKNNTFTAKETIAITQLSHLLKEISAKKPFKNTKFYDKINKTLFIILYSETKQTQICKSSILLDLSKKDNKILLDLLEQDYDFICEEINQIIEEGKVLKTLNGPNGLLQIRTKDSRDFLTGNYHPIFFDGKQISHKNYALYFKKKFVNDFVLTGI
jgi:hypothetical protein